MFVWAAPPMGTRPSNSHYNRAEAGPLSGIAAETKVANMKTEALVSNYLIDIHIMRWSHFFKKSMFGNLGPYIF